MTGYGKGEAQSEGNKYTVEIKSVNHRYSDYSIRLPKHLSSFEDKVRSLASEYISRGKIDIFVSCEEYGENNIEVKLNEPLAKAYIEATEKLCTRFNLVNDISASFISRFPDVLTVEKKEEDEENIWSVLKQALETALKSFVAMREIEGQKLKDDLLEKSGKIENLVKKIEERAPLVVIEYKNRLDAKLKEFVDQNIIDENRIAAEVAIFADRCSIDEEIVRLKSHLSQLKHILENENQVGRKLDFLVQEINREVNTIGSKANDLEIIKNVVEAKSEIEKLREQIQNLE